VSCVCAVQATGQVEISCLLFVEWLPRHCQRHGTWVQYQTGEEGGVSSVHTVQATEVEIDHLLNGCHVADSNVAPGFNIRQRRRVGVSGMCTVQATGHPIIVL